METLKLREEYIKLGQAIKAVGYVENGVEAKFVIQDGYVKVNGEVEFQRGKKLVAGDIVEFDGNVLKIEYVIVHTTPHNYTIMRLLHF